jgi:tetratricopeptide (TPR) repeat protein
VVRRKRKRKQKRKVKRILFLVPIALLILLAQPTYHLFQIRSAQDRFDMSKIAYETTWVKENAPWLDKVPLVEDSFLWLALNQGEPIRDQDLLEHSDDKHRFWLLQLKLQQEQFKEANQILPMISSPSTQLLGQGLIEMTQGDYDAALEKLNGIPDTKLSKEEKVLKSLAVSRCFLGKEDEMGAKKEWEKAKALAPDHPLVIEEEFDLALMDADWKEAERLSVQMEQWSGNNYNLNFQTKKALLYLALGQTSQWDKAIETLSQSSKSESYQRYLLGIKKYQEGEWKASQAMLEEALTGELSSAIRNDANQALKQVNERLDADKALQIYN